jgi:hypothetical protein
MIPDGLQVPAKRAAACFSGHFFQTEFHPNQLHSKGHPGWDKEFINKSFMGNLQNVTLGYGTHQVSPELTTVVFQNFKNGFSLTTHSLLPNNT